MSILSLGSIITMITMIITITMITIITTAIIAISMIIVGGYFWGKRGRQRGRRTSRIRPSGWRRKGSTVDTVNRIRSSQSIARWTIDIIITTIIYYGSADSGRVGSHGGGGPIIERRFGGCRQRRRSIASIIRRLLESWRFRSLIGSGSCVIAVIGSSGIIGMIIGIGRSCSNV